MDCERGVFIQCPVLVEASHQDDRLLVRVADFFACGRQQVLPYLSWILRRQKILNHLSSRFIVSSPECPPECSKGFCNFVFFHSNHCCSPVLSDSAAPRRK